MIQLQLLTETEKKKLINKRAGETKFGEQIKLVSNINNIYEELNELDVEFVLFGINESIGSFANFNATHNPNNWKPILKSLFNLQNNCFTSPEKVAVLGCLTFENEQEELLKLNPDKVSDVKRTRKLVAAIDKVTTQLVHDIVKAGKTPIIISSNQSSSYGIIKGTSLANNNPICSINMDAQLDFRNEEGRHSENAFTYAFTEGFLKKYVAFGVHEKLIIDNTFNKVKKLKKFVKYNTYEATHIRKDLSLSGEMQNTVDFFGKNTFGLDIDCNNVDAIPSSLKLPSGFSTKKTREFINFFSKQHNVAYLHISEANLSLASKKSKRAAANLMAYLVTDFMSAKKQH